MRDERRGSNSAAERLREGMGEKYGPRDFIESNKMNIVAVRLRACSIDLFFFLLLLFVFER